MNPKEIDPTLVLIGSGSLSVNRSGSPLGRHRYPTGHKSLLRRLLRHQGFPPHSSMLYRAEAIDLVGAFNPRFRLAEDYDLWLRLSEVGSLGCIDEPLVKIRNHDMNISHTKHGRLGVGFANAATVCHRLRASDRPDPSRDADPREWDAFAEWVRQRANEQGVFKSRDALVKVRTREHDRGSRLPTGLRTGMAVLQTGRAIPLLKQQWWGLSLPKRLAREWATRSRNSMKP